MWSVFLEKNAIKALGKAPKEIQEKLEKWKDIVQLQGPKGLFEVKILVMEVTPHDYRKKG